MHLSYQMTNKELRQIHIKVTTHPRIALIIRAMPYLFLSAALIYSFLVQSILAVLISFFSVYIAFKHMRKSEHWLYDIDNDGIRITTPGFETYSKWSTFVKAYEDHRYVYLLKRANSSAVLPKNAFIDQTQYREFCTIISNHIWDVDEGIRMLGGCS